MKKTNGTFVALIAGLVVGSSPAWAQMAPPASSQSPANSTAAQTTMPQAKRIQGTIKSVDPSKKSITLDNGTTLMIPAFAAVETNNLKKGAKISAMYEEQGGEKIVTSLQVEPASKS